jgi:predicted negative regulator of RcsB-dependent stress response
MCCNCDEKQIILKCALKIQIKNPTYSLINIISSLIYAYFSLNLAEQSTDNTDFDIAYKYLKWNHKQINKQQFKTIYYNIGCSDDPVYQDIRRCLLGLTL